MEIYTNNVGFIKVTEQELDNINKLNDTSHAEGEFIEEVLTFPNISEEEQQELYECDAIYFILKD